MNLIDQGQNNSNLVISGKYILKGVIDQGSFGKVFRASVKDSDAFVAIKVEKRSTLAYATLSRESKVLSLLNGKSGFPSFYEFGKEEKFNYMVTSLLGLNLEKHMRLIGRQFSLKTTLMLADQILSRIETLHGLDYIHRDIKPENFVMGLGRTSRNLFIIDFGLAKQYKDASGEHVSCNENKGLIGTARYASINAHLGFEQSRRDDLEAIAYTLIYFMKGKLPWQNLQASNLEEKYKKIAEMKINTPVEILCQDLPKEFAIFLTYAKNLRFDELPHYRYLKKLFRKLFLQIGYDFDYKYDWNDFNREISVGNTSDILNPIDANLKGKAPMKHHHEVSGWKNFHLEPPKTDRKINSKQKLKKRSKKRKKIENSNDQDEVNTTKLSKGVCIDKQHRILKGRKQFENLSSAINTSRAIHLIGAKIYKTDDEDHSPQQQQLESHEVVSNKAENLAISLAKLKTIESDEYAFPNKKNKSRKNYLKLASDKYLSGNVPHKGLFERFISMKTPTQTIDAKSDNLRQEEDLSDSVINEWKGRITIGLRMNHLTPKIKI